MRKDINKIRAARLINGIFHGRWVQVIDSSLSRDPYVFSLRQSSRLSAGESSREVFVYLERPSLFSSFVVPVLDLHESF